ncbi:MAG TPA: NAD(P)-dependent alcohol dehydrogenase [Patescibacteria group bacterium]|nr:NAD(P)-dependent alcohol dehydrogenase [Patescibacteria group bacterium]
MKALILTQDSFQISETETPKPREGEALIKLKAAALNHRDQFIREGKYAKIQYPAIVGSDGCGEVVEVNDEFNRGLLNKDVVINPSFAWGDNPRAQGSEFNVFGMPAQGTLAEYVCVPLDRLHEKPEHLTAEQASALPLAGVTAFRAVSTQGRVEGGQNVLVTGIGGGVALFAMQFAQALGANVFVTSGSDEKLQRAQELGALGGVNYKAVGWDKELLKTAGKIDLIIDGAGGTQINTLLNVITPGGSIVSYGATLGAPENVNIHRIFWKQIRWQGTTMGTDDDFRDMLHLVGKQQMTPVIDSTRPFAEAVSAFDAMKRGEQFGKLVVTF